MAAKLLTKEEVAKELGISVPTLRNYIKKGKIIPVHIGGLLRFSREEIDRVKKEGIRVNYKRGRDDKNANN